MNHVANAARYHLCFSGDAACSGAVPCAACLEQIKSRVVVACATVDGELLQQLYAACRALQELGRHPAEVGLFVRTPDQQADAFFGAFDGGLRAMHEDMAGSLQHLVVARPIGVPAAAPETVAPLGAQAYGGLGPWAAGMGRQTQAPHGPLPAADSEVMRSAPAPVAATPATPAEDARSVRVKAAQADAADLERRAELREKQRRAADLAAAEKARLEALTKPMDAEEILASVAIADGASDPADAPDEKLGANGALPS